MKQEIHFCTASDGARIAYSLAGEGTPVVKAANWLNHLEFDWESPIWRHTLEPIARRHLLVRYDERGNGLSDWELDDLSFDAWVRDLETVVDAAELERFALFGISQGCAVSIAYATRHPERVSRLVLYGGYERGWRARGDADEIEVREALHVLMQKGWGTDNPAFRQIFTSRFIPGATPEQMMWFNDLQRMTSSAENAVRLSVATSTIDVGDLLPRVGAPTLVLHARRDAVVPFESGRALATRIPGARFVPLEGQNHLMLGQDTAWQRYIEEILAFLESPNPLLSPAEIAAAKSNQPPMSHVSWGEADRLFDEALDVPPGERSGWLDERCGSNRELRELVGRLLAASDAHHDELATGGGVRGSIGAEVLSELRGEAELSEGETLGSYTVVARLGEGGMGTVYRARHEGLDRDVAVKALAGVVPGDRSGARRFEREAKLLARLDHPNIATVHDFLFADDRPYLVMELVEGPTLRERLASGPLPLEETVSIASQLVEALDEAHRANIVHRDLKPSNIKLTSKGRVKVLDFGLAKSTAGRRGDDEATTRSGTVLGTPGYVSPEQIRGEEVDARTDVWAFGCIVYEMLTGTRAFDAATVSEGFASVLRDDVDWGRIPDGTPPSLVELVKRCLKRDRDARLAGIGEARAFVAPEDATVEPPRSDDLFWVVVAICLLAVGLLVYVLAT